jgi:hypothetical protein
MIFRYSFFRFWFYINKFLRFFQYGGDRRPGKKHLFFIRDIAHPRPGTAGRPGRTSPLVFFMEKKKKN